jgi:hypothetical protein
MRKVPEAALRREYTRRLWQLLKARPEPHILRIYAIRCAMHYHFLALAEKLAGGRDPIVNSF